MAYELPDNEETKASMKRAQAVSKAVKKTSEELEKDWVPVIVKWLLGIEEGE